MDNRQSVDYQQSVDDNIVITLFNNGDATHDPGIGTSQIRKLSEKKRAKYHRMYEVILNTPHGPHLLQEEKFRPSFNAVLEKLPQIEPPRTTSDMLHRSFQKLIAKRILNKPATVSNRRKVICQGVPAVLRDVAWDENSAWGDENTSQLAESSLFESGIKVEHRALSWKEQQEVENNEHHCFKSSMLRWSWSMEEDDKKDKEV